MNKQRRNQISDLIEEVRALQDKVAEIKGEEDDAYQNLPESLQDSERGQTMQEAIDALDYAESGLDDAIQSLEEARDVG